MKTRLLIWDYINALLKKWYFTLLAVVEFIGIILLPLRGVYIQPWFYLLIFGVIFLCANFLVYRDNRIKLQEMEVQRKNECNELRRRIAELESAFPQLDLFFKAGNELAKIQKIIVEDLPEEPDIENMVSVEKQKLEDSYQQKEISESVKARISYEMLGVLMGVKKSSEEYEKDCKSYLDQYRNYLISKYNYDIYKARYRHVSLAVKNTGRIPGEDIVLVAHFPDVFHFWDKDDWEDMIGMFKPPTVPERPKVMKSPLDILDKYRLSSVVSPYLTTPTNTPNLGSRNVSGPFISPKKSTEVVYEIRSLLHNFTEEDLDMVGFLVTDDGIGKSWDIEYEIHAGNLPEPVRGTLGLIVETGKPLQE